MLVRRRPLRDGFVNTTRKVNGLTELFVARRQQIVSLDWRQINVKHTNVTANCAEKKKLANTG